MSAEQGFIDYVKTTQPKMWELIRKTADESGLIVVDEANDAITATNRLLWCNPVLHDCLATLVDQWCGKQTTPAESFRALLNPPSKD
ncbi:hypothetical protein Mmc1_0378 [Magnetococcus marinus MC-1]|uniref:Uncharacterized protein n=1 Tax=Magnetococcus marinus (strain ATCC BAA-1437 / JCM 17883 / MC-1) TaxID=156889 RepID=A0L4L1_MAGMM|nr:hypothetical protein [Magnetococcus marinus]ABK42904.1 hypothetical protein Mmc1_0378 [Magnetococcus marinus MC-1]